MKFAPVCPIHIYEALLEQSQSTGVDVIGDYFLLLAHDVLANEKRYNEFFCNKLPQYLGYTPTIIMDNSVIELGDAVCVDTLLAASNVVNATCVAIPDVLQDGLATIRKAAEFINDWIGVANKPKLMFIPQGKNQLDFLECLQHSNQFETYIEWIGIPRNLTGRVFASRIIAATLIARMYYDARIHMLGFSDNMFDDIYTCIKCADLIDGIDSAVPLRFATNYMPIFNQETKRPHYGVDPGPRGNWWDTVVYNQLMGTNIKQIRELLDQPHIIL